MSECFGVNVKTFWVRVCVRDVFCGFFWVNESIQFCVRVLVAICKMILVSEGVKCYFYSESQSNSTHHHMEVYMFASFADTVEESSNLTGALVSPRHQVSPHHGANAQQTDADGHKVDGTVACPQEPPGQKHDHRDHKAVQKLKKKN